LDELWAQSRNCLIERDWLCASAKYRQILKQHAGRRESLAALISLAKIELRHLGKPDAALRHFSAYRQQYPKGPLMEEAVWGLAESHRQLGNKPQELGILRSFTRDYPNSSLAPRVHRRIKEIEKTVSN
jgi:outer membrane protein assembly factor BamD (BamD/ComL family)